jgi:hypothetical protein
MTGLTAVPRNVRFMELQRGECQFECSPTDNVPTAVFVFCGNPVRDERCPYCVYHALVARRGSEAARRDTRSWEPAT